MTFQVVQWSINPKQDPAIAPELWCLIGRFWGSKLLLRRCLDVLGINMLGMYSSERLTARPSKMMLRRQHSCWNGPSSRGLVDFQVCMVDTTKVGSFVHTVTAINEPNKLECNKACDSDMSCFTCPSLTSFKYIKGSKVDTIKTPLSRRMCDKE